MQIFMLALQMFSTPSGAATPSEDLLALLPENAVRGQVVDHKGDRYRVVTIDLRRVQLDLTGLDVAQTFDEVGPHVAATNAGIFHTVDEPVGLWVSGGVEQHSLERADGAGNFYLKPNGVFWIDGDGAHVSVTADYTPGPGLRLATQSGPMLVMHGELHPAFRPESASKKLRSGVGVSDPWTVHLAVSEGGVRFHDMATLFKDVLASPDALFLEGTISALSGPGLPSAETRRDVAGFLVATPRNVGAALRDGDVVYQRSTSAQSEAIALATGSEWTHTGLIRQVNGEPWVLEAVQPVKLTPYADWVKRGNGGRVAVQRHVEADGIWTAGALARLDALQEQWVGRDYDARFEPGDDALYCSELVREAYLGAAGVELVPLRPVSTYQVSDPELRRAMAARWGTVPEALMVVAPSDLFAAAGLVVVR